MLKEQGLDHTVHLLREGYRYILNRRQSFQANVFATTLLGQQAVCMGGKEATVLFYDDEKFQRQGAAPNRARETLFGEKGVQSLDGEAHRKRKQLFKPIMSTENLDTLARLTEEAWDNAIKQWEQMDEVVLYDEVKKLLCEVACQWTGVPIKKAEIQERTEQLSRLFESSAKIGPRHWHGRHARNVLEQWLTDIVKDVQAKTRDVDKATCLYRFASHHDENEQRLSPKVVAVELLNLLRPIVAIAVYICFIVHALQHFSEVKTKLTSNFEKYAEPFIHEVRRYYPFFPFVTARVKKDFTWHNFTFKKGMLALLDVYGTNHDPELWSDPELFSLDRFAEPDVHMFKLIPQGGGAYVTGHRCPGEAATVRVMKVSLDYLVNRIDYE